MKIIVADDDGTSRLLAAAAVLSANFILVTSQRDRGQVLEGMRAGIDSLHNASSSSP